MYFSFFRLRENVAWSLGKTWRKIKSHDREGKRGKVNLLGS